MIVAVESGLSNIKNELSDRGYTVVELENYEFGVDAIIYKSVHLKPCNDSYFMNTRNPGGILMVYANNKSIDEIDNILKTKVYGPLF